MASASVLDLLKPVAGRALEMAFNRIVALDPETRDAIALLEGRRVQVAIEAPVLALEVSVHEGRLAVGPPSPTGGSNEPDLAVRGTFGGLLSQLPFLRAVPGTGAGRVKIAGDADLARRLQQLAERFDPDWNLPFTDVFGDVIGVQVASALRAAFRAGRDGASRLARDAADFLTEESRDLVGRAELEAHLDDVDALRDRVERLHARMQHLHRRLGGSEASAGSAAIKDPSAGPGTKA